MRLPAANVQYDYELERLLRKDDVISPGGLRRSYANRLLERVEAEEKRLARRNAKQARSGNGASFAWLVGVGLIGFAVGGHHLLMVIEHVIARF